MPGGTWIEGQDEKENVPLVFIGYKYNKKKTLKFIHVLEVVQRLLIF